MDEEFIEFSPAEIEAMRFAYRQMLEGFSKGFVVESEKRQLARSILEALGRPVTTEAVKQVLMQVQREN